MRLMDEGMGWVRADNGCFLYFYAQPVENSGSNSSESTRVSQRASLH